VLRRDFSPDLSPKKREGALTALSIFHLPSSVTIKSFDVLRWATNLFHSDSCLRFHIFSWKKRLFRHVERDNPKFVVTSPVAAAPKGASPGSVGPGFLSF